MNDLFDLPSERPLPDAVRIRARQRVLNGIRQDHGRGRWAMVAAAVVILALVVSAGSFAIRQGDSRPVGESGPPPTGNTWLTPDEQYEVQRGVAPPAVAARCAAQRPAEAVRWQPLLTASLHGVTVVAFATSEGPVFCETTPATVTVSAPAGGDTGGDVRATFISSLGTVAGVMNPQFTTLSVGPGAGSAERSLAGVENGVFVVPNGLPRGSRGLTFYVGGSPKAQGGARSVPPGAIPAAVPAVTDRPGTPGERSTPDGRRLDDCFARSPFPVADAADWQPTYSQALNEHETAQLGKYGSLLAICIIDDSPRGSGVRLKIDDETAGNGFRDHEATPGPLLFTTSVFYAFRGKPSGASVSDTVAVAGMTKSPNVVSVSLSRRESAPVQSPVHNGTFLLPDVDLGEKVPGAEPTSTITAYDAQGQVLGTTVISL
ncbi:hypothetical protein [Amycolatopsis pithecellobii]|uniref:Uncharacterized protein n=1 Tax=Amycolatopsis pithecellobii TaxID=664692 RepID=A0A6N7YLV4_9PSEU|nr:hypothetical protein [Amycolatopsis pithecellobii]MTD53907.1 hypothetical protein [Amycolatopsis pithecellobii]